MTDSPPIVGAALANRVADRLLSGRKLCFSHPEYCGIGLEYVAGTFVCAEVQDGEIASQGEYLRNKEHGEEMEFRAFSNRAEFVGWLAEQSDGSLSGMHLRRTWLHNNQRLTLARLISFDA